MESINLELDFTRIHIFLLLNDLNYETYLRQSYLYCIRKLKKDIIAMEYKKNENLALVDKYRYQSQEILYLQEQLDCQRVELHAIKDRYNSYQEGLTQQLYSLSKKNAESADNIARLKDHLLECENIINNQKKRLDQANEKIFQLENCISVIKPQVTKQEEMEKQIEQLTKQLLLWEDDSEANEKTLKQMEEMANQLCSQEMIINTYKKELNDVKLALTEKNNLNNTLITKLANLERYNEKEDNSKNEYTETINRQRSLFDQQVQILEDKYQSVKQINLQLEMQIMDLQCDLEKANLETIKNKQIIEKMKTKEESTKETQKESTL
jgi:chromosome segregation ATPase